MKPYYRDNAVMLFHGDCRAVLPTVDLTDVGAVVADPPYGETSLGWDQWPEGWISSFAERVSSIASLWCFGSVRMFLERRDDFAAWILAQDVVWEKHNGSSFHADRFKRVHEHILQWYRGSWANVYKSPVKVNEATARTVRRKQRPPHMGHIEAGAYASQDGGPKLQRSVIFARSCHGYSEHPTQKPISLLSQLIEYSVAPDRIALDPMCGSGSLLVAAKQSGRRAIGVEIDEANCEIAARRLSAPNLIAEAV